MKKIFLGLILFLIVFICFGCGGSKGGGNSTSQKTLSLYGKPDIPVASLKNNNIKTMSNEVLLNNCYWTMVPNDAYVNTNIYGYYYIDNIKQNKPVILSKDFSEAGEVDCFKILFSQDLVDGGSILSIIGQKYGKCKLIASCEGLTKSIMINVFDSFYLIPNPPKGVIINQNGHSFSTVKSDCALYYDKDGFGIYVVSEKAYEIPLNNLTSEADQLFNIKNVDIERLTSSTYTEHLYLTRDNKLLVCQVPGGYIKILSWGGYGYLFEFTSTGTFN